jgi:hypothetical protein|tara:strand:+ start:351 stop:581 length:231 start_codon:yes stop_codon:yes gene_type:complete
VYSKDRSGIVLTYFLWIILFAILILFAGAMAWTLKRPQEESGESEEDLEEWTCPSCGFQVQMGTECIYCGEKKPIV